METEINLNQAASEMAKAGAAKAAAILGGHTTPKDLPLLIDIEDIAKDAMALREKMRCVLWDSYFDEMFGGAMDEMESSINNIISHLTPLMGWARLNEISQEIKN